MAGSLFLDVKILQLAKTPKSGKPPLNQMLSEEANRFGKNSRLPDALWVLYSKDKIEKRSPIAQLSRFQKNCSVHGGSCDPLLPKFHTNELQSSEVHLGRGSLPRLIFCFYRLKYSPPQSFHVCLLGQRTATKLPVPELDFCVCSFSISIHSLIH